MEKLLLIARDYPLPWSSDLLDFIAAEQGMKRPLLDLLLPKGLEDLVDLYFDNLEKMTFSAIPEDGRIQSRVFNLVHRFFSLLDQDRLVAERVLATPITTTKKLRITWHFADRIWQLVDPSSDFTFYTRRATLAGIIAKNLLNFSIEAWEKRLDDDFKALGSFIKCKKKLLAFFSKGEIV